MPWTKQSLQSDFNLADEEVLKTLKVCGLPVDEDEYSDEEIESKFKLVRSYFDSNRTDTYTGAADLLALEQGGEAPIDDTVQSDSHALTKNSGRGRKPKSSTDTDKGVFENKLQSMSEILAIASKQCNTRISLKEATLILDACGLPDTDFYSSEDSERFLEACDLIKKQNKSYEEVAEHFGVGSPSKTRVNSQQQLLELLGDSTIVVDENLMDLVNKITAKQTNGVNLHKLVRQSYFMNLSHQMSENQDDTDTFFADLESRLMDYIEGKSRARSLGTTWEWAQNSLPPSSTKLIGSPEDSNNGTSGE